MPETRELLAVALRAARVGGARALEDFGRPILVERKEDGSPVTVADRETEAAIRAVVRRRYPGHLILGEEGGRTGGPSTVRWIIDPIDGTQSYVRGVPLFAVLIGVEVRGVPTAGVIHLPALGETVEAARGLGCRFNGRTARVSSVDRLEEATLLASSVRGIERRGVPFRRLSEATRVQRGWGDAYGYSLVATGRAEVMLDAHVQIWDTAPLLPILEEAGGRFTDWAGRRTIRGPDAVGTNGRLHAEVLTLLGGRHSRGRRAIVRTRARR